MSLLGCDLEAIKFQSNSLFPKELTKLFQLIIDFAQRHDDEFGKVMTNDEALIKHTKIRTFIKTVIEPMLIKVVKKYTNLNLKDIIVELPDEFSNVCDAYVLIFRTKLLTALDLTNEGLNSNYDQQSLEEALDIQKRINKSKNMLMTDDVLYIRLGIPVGLFVIQDMFDNADKMILTASELTAIYLHEFGHVFTSIEYSADASYFGYYGNNVLRNLTAQFKEEPSKTIKEVVSYAEKHPVDNKLHKVIVSSGTKVLKQMDDVLFKDAEIKDQDRAGYVRTTGMYTALVIILFLVAIYTVIKGVLKIAILSDIEEIIDHNKLNSREYITHRSSTMTERLSDEYVSRFGMSKYFNSAMIKLTLITKEAERHGYIIPEYDKLVRQNMLLSAALQTVVAPDNLISYLLFLKHDGKQSAYESHFNRLQRNINNMYDVLKNTQLHPDIKAQLVADIDDMNKTLKEHSQKRNSMVIFEKVLKFIISAPGFIFIRSPKYIFGSANADKEYTELFERIDGMLSNKSSYYAAKIAGALKR